MSETATAVRLPEPKDVRDLLVGLLDRPVDLALTVPFALEPGERGTWAVYVDDSLAVRAVGLADLPFSAWAGGALGLLPPGGVQDCVAERALTPMLEENVYEVLNIAAALMNGEDRPHLRLYAVHPPSAVPPVHVVSFAQTLGRRLDLDVTVGGYGRGRFSLVAQP